MKEFLTFKFGKFYFCDNFDKDIIAPLLIKSVVLNETIADLPILPDLAATLQPDMMYSSIASTAAIEGNPIPQSGVKLIAEHRDEGAYQKKHTTEIKNLLQAYKFLEERAPEVSSPFVLTEEFVRRIHHIMTQDIPHKDNRPGYYRNGPVFVGDAAHGGVYTPPKILEDIKNLMRELIAWINSDEIIALNPFIRAALFHYHFCLIHPFWDGNGRTARLLEAAILHTSHVKYIPKMLSNYYYRHVDDYYIAYSKSIRLKKEVTPFLEFALNGVVETLSEIKERIILFIRIFALQDYYLYLKNHKDLTQRQYDLLLLLVHDFTFETFTLHDLLEKSPFSLLYKKVSTQTARRDLKKLTAMNVLHINEKKEYSLNLRVLD